MSYLINFGAVVPHASLWRSVYDRNHCEFVPHRSYDPAKVKGGSALTAYWTCHTAKMAFGLLDAWLSHTGMNNPSRQINLMGIISCRSVTENPNAI